MSRGIKYLLCDIERVRDDNNVFNVVVHDSLVNSTLHGEELSFGSGNIDGPMECFDNRFVIEMDMRNRSSNLIFYVSIQYDNGGEGINWCFNYDFLQVTNILLCIWNIRMKRKTIWKNINDTISRFEFIIEKGERRKKLISFIMHINKRQFQSTSLFSHEIINGCIMTWIFMQPIRAEDTVDNMIREKGRLA